MEEWIEVSVLERQLSLHETFLPSIRKYNPVNKNNKMATHLKAKLK
jgi:hypothetical protein